MKLFSAKLSSTLVCVLWLFSAFRCSQLLHEKLLHLHKKIANFARKCIICTKVFPRLLLAGCRLPSTRRRRSFALCSNYHTTCFLNSHGRRQMLQNSRMGFLICFSTSSTSSDLAVVTGNLSFNLQLLHFESPMSLATGWASSSWGSSPRLLELQALL